MMFPILHAGALTCANCGHDWHQHIGYPPYTGPEWCEGGGYVEIGKAEIEDDYPYEVPACLCGEFEPVDWRAFEAYQDEWTKLSVLGAKR